MCDRSRHPRLVFGDGHVPDFLIELIDKNLRIVRCYAFVKGKEDAFQWICERRGLFIYEIHFE
jgi:hypothetical protein